MSDLYRKIYLQDCPYCRGAAVLEEEEGWCHYVICHDCGSHTAEIEYHSEDDREESARQAAYLWNIGKVINSNPNE